MVFTIGKYKFYFKQEGFNMEKITVKHFTTGEKQANVSVLECETEKELLHLLKVLGSEYTNNKNHCYMNITIEKA